ncbi:MAG: lipopolysaccharide biosynthesis protein, partial [Acidimicrobiales bacterium]
MDEAVVGDDRVTPPGDVGAPPSPHGSSTWGRLRSGLLGRGAISLLVATAGVNVSNFLFHVVVSRLLGPGHYGAVGAILSLISLLAIPIGAAQLAVTQAVIDDVKSGGTFHLARVLRTAVIGGLVGLVAFAALTPVFDGFLHTSSPVPLLLVSLWIPLATVGAVLQGALIGEYRFRPVAFASFVGGGPVRLALGAAAALAGFGVEGAITATVAAQLFTTASLLVSARRRVVTSQRVALRAKRGDIALSVGALSGYTAL